MSHDGATAGHDAAVTRLVYGHPRPDPPRRQTILVEKRVPPRVSLLRGFRVRPRRFGRGRHPRRTPPRPAASRLRAGRCDRLLLGQA